MKIDKKLTQPILDWCLKESNRDKYFRDPNYHGGNVLGQTNLDNINIELMRGGFPYESLIAIEKEILEHYNFEEIYRDPVFGTMISYSIEGHEVHTHSDKNAGMNIHTRINLMLSKPDDGGNPVIDNVEIDVEENTTWHCVAGYYRHSSTKVKGNKPRLVISFGYQIDKKQLNELQWLKK